MYRRSFKDYFGRDRKALYIVLSIVMISVLTITVVYATLSNEVYPRYGVTEFSLEKYLENFSDRSCVQ